ncbi:MAG: right-handed parallel beta-helix repeat-containing protein, partial [Ignavibacteriaceae bacterium]
MIKSNKKFADCRLKTVDFFCILLTALCLLAFTTEINPTIRYVSPTGNNIPPYLSWEAAANSIQDAIDVSEFGDTIYVANGVYEEQVIMIPGLSLIGAGTDSCIIDTRTFLSTSLDISVTVADSCLLKGFKIIAGSNNSIGTAIAGSGNRNCLITNNNVTSAFYGIFLDATFFELADMTVYGNKCYDVRVGVELFNSNAIVRNNFIITANISEVRGINIGAFDNNYFPIIDSNYIIQTRGNGIYKSFGATPTITNNKIIMRGEGGTGSRSIRLSSSDSGYVINNLMYAEANYNGGGIDNLGILNLKLYNNYLTGNFRSTQIYAIRTGPADVKNNVVTNVLRGIEASWGTEDLVVKYNNLWNNDTNYSGFTPDSTNLSVDPMVINDDTTQGELDFRLQMFSPLIDAGDPDILDKDGSRSDIGLYGGPYGWTYTYMDLAPRPP